MPTGPSAAGLDSTDWAPRLYSQQQPTMPSPPAKVLILTLKQSKTSSLTLVQDPSEYLKTWKEHLRHRRTGVGSTAAGSPKVQPTPILPAPPSPSPPSRLTLEGAGTGRQLSHRPVPPVRNFGGWLALLSWMPCRRWHTPVAHPPAQHGPHVAAPDARSSPF